MGLGFFRPPTEVTDAYKLLSKEEQEMVLEEMFNKGVNLLVASGKEKMKREMHDILLNKKVGVAKQDSINITYTVSWGAIMVLETIGGLIRRGHIDPSHSKAERGQK